MQDWMTLRWTVLLTRGLIGIVFGVVAMAWPEETVTVVVVLWGCWALVDGIAMLVFVRAVPGTAPKVVAILAGVVALFIAFFAIARPGSRRQPSPGSSASGWSSAGSWRSWRRSGPTRRAGGGRSWPAVCWTA